MSRTNPATIAIIVLSVLAVTSTSLAQDSGAASYEDTLRGIARRRAALAVEYRDAATDSLRAAILDRARQEIVRSVVETISPCWYGTPWDFNGTTQVPGTGSIACGYFVTTVLRDAGFKVERVRLAQQASETIIRSLVHTNQVRRFSDAPLADFLSAVREFGPGLYVVGLDCHVGFLACDDRAVRFVHSSFLEPAYVIDEDAATSLILANSRYRVIGKLTGDDELTIKWLAGSSIPTASR